MSKQACPFRGSMVALITPFRDGEVDYDALDALVELQIDGGQGALVPCGSTGESATLTHEEHNRVIEAVVRKAAGRVPVIAGTGSNSTREAIDLTQEAERSGADGALLISPYYVKPTQDGIVSHYEAVAARTKLPLIVYNIPGRTASTIEPPTLAELGKIDNVVAVKESTGSMDRVMDTIAACGDSLSVLSGDDSMTLPMILMGAVGAISAAANVIPREMARITELAIEGRFVEARDLQYSALPVMRACFLEVNPIPVKAAAAMLGLCTDEMRLPLRPLAEPHRTELRAALESFGLTVRGAAA